MKLDMDLVRQILVKIEDDPEAVGLGFRTISFEGKSPQEVSYHVMQLVEAGFSRAENLTNSRDGLVYLPTRLTWEGHQFLMAARNDTLWQKAKKLTLEKTGGLGFEFLKTALMKQGMDAIGGG